MPHNWPLWGALLGTFMYILGEMGALGVPRRGIPAGRSLAAFAHLSARP